jgi:hypothetical protein
MIKSGNSFEDKTTDSFINEAIKQTLEYLKIDPPKFQATFNKNNPPKFQAVFDGGSTVNFDIYEEAIDFLTKNPDCKVFVK